MVAVKPIFLAFIGAISPYGMSGLCLLVAPMGCSWVNCQSSPTHGEDEEPGMAIATGPPQGLVQPPAGPSPARPEGPSFLGQPDEALLLAISTRRPIRVRPTRGSSLSMRLDLEGDIDAAFKPKTHRGQRWYGEVVAYRLSRLLGIGRVPPAITRKIRRPVFERLLEQGEPELLARIDAEAIAGEGNLIEGATMYWVPVIHTAEVEHAYELETWTRWLHHGASIPPDQVSFASQVSETIVFDYLTANWDRWSGGNVFLGPQRRTLLIMDNNAAFVTKLRPDLAERYRAPLLQVERFGAGLYRRLVGMDRTDVLAELAEDPAGARLLSEEQLDGLFERRDQIVERIEALSRRHGRDAVLCFP